MYSQIRKFGETTPIVIDSIDTDVLATAAYVSTKVDGALGVKMRRRVVDASTLLLKQLSELILKFHAMTGCDVTSSFYGKGKCYFNVLKFDNSIPLSGKNYWEGGGPGAIFVVSS